ncbi:MAG: phospholipid/cholesterol/gamma-HCH transport system substrate-binding protein [Solirubrobacteraceae bacterium]|jgi:phospholipid/cholesterol/gamma-HCH transport system substrate-binding protein|nr:phospholipid/cholesterol/gamma-HCH transport system substrate-binding protein [Solirubrobacteraceae bacterium]
MTRAIKKHLTDFIAILVLLLLSIVVAVFILSNERFQFPFFSPTPYTLKAEFQTLQAVAPGQGQTVRVSGVQVGTIGAVTLRGGLAVVTMDMDQKYRHLVHENASLLLRPKTGLDDMFIELNPGSGPSPVAPASYTFPASNTLPDINVDEVFSALDSDTRDYLNLLVNGAGQGLQGRTNDLTQILERFEPTHQDLARVNQAIAQRGADLRQLVDSLRRLDGDLAAQRPQLVSLVDAGSQVFHALAAEQANISTSITDLPATLRQATATLNKVQRLATLLGPTATSLLPAARRLPAADAALAALAQPSSPIIKNQIRPFVVAARPLVRNLRPAAVNLAKAAPNLGKTFDVVNNLVNMLGYNPGNAEHGYLFWLAWLFHNGRTLFSTQDANGDYRPVFVQANCATLASIANGFPGAEALFNLTPILSNLGLCPQQAAAIAHDATLKPHTAKIGGTSVPVLPALPAPLSQSSLLTAAK